LLDDHAFYQISHAVAMRPVKKQCQSVGFFRVHEANLLHEAIPDASFFSGGEMVPSGFEAAALFLPPACCFNVAMNSSNDVFDSAAPDIYEIKSTHEK